MSGPRNCYLLAFFFKDLLFFVMLPLHLFCIIFALLLQAKTSFVIKTKQHFAVAILVKKILQI